MRSDAKRSHRGRRSFAALERRGFRRTKLERVVEEAVVSPGSKHTTGEPSTAKGNGEGANETTHNFLPTGEGLSTASLGSPGFENTNFTLLQVIVGNNRGFLLNRAKLEAHLQLNGNPTFVALTETLLEGDEQQKDTVKPQLTGYTLVSQRNRRDGRKGGGVALFVKDEHACCVNLLQHSETHERSWHLVHTSHGPLLLGVWYRHLREEKRSR